MKNSKKSKRISLARERKFLNTYTKIFVTVVTAISMIDLQLCFIMPFVGASVPETLAVALVTEILGVSLGYFLKSYSETREVKRNELEERKLDSSQENQDEDIE